MNLASMALILIFFQEQYSLPPSNSAEGVRLVIIVPEPLEQSMVELKLESIDEKNISTQNPILVQGRGWRLLHEAANRWMLQRTDANDQEQPRIRWPWRHETEAAWHESQWDNLSAPAPLASILQSRGPNHRSIWWILVAVEGLATILLVLSIMIFRWANHPAACLKRKLNGIPPGTLYWSILHQFIQDYLQKTWNCHGHDVIHQWHAQRHNSKLGRRLELLLEALAEARYGQDENPAKGLHLDWIQWLNDAVKVRSRRLQQK
jgi:hypothetical protein